MGLEWLEFLGWRKVLDGMMRNVAGIGSGIWECVVLVKRMGGHHEPVTETVKEY